MSNDFTNTYTAFSGADLVPTLNGTVIGEVENVHYEERLEINFDDPYYPVVGYIDVCIFDRDTFRQNLKTFDNEFVVTAANEYGQSMLIEFENIVFTKREGGFSADDIILCERFYFKATGLSFNPGVALKTEEPATTHERSLFEELDKTLEEIKGELGSLVPKEDKSDE